MNIVKFTNNDTLVSVLLPSGTMYISITVDNAIINNAILFDALIDFSQFYKVISCQFLNELATEATQTVELSNSNQVEQYKKNQ